MRMERGRQRNVSFGGGAGETVLAANTVLNQFGVLAAFGLDGFANAAEALRAVGATAILPHPPSLSSVGVSMWMEMKTSAE